MKPLVRTALLVIIGLVVAVTIVYYLSITDDRVASPSSNDVRVKKSDQAKLDTLSLADSTSPYIKFDHKERYPAESLHWENASANIAKPPASGGNSGWAVDSAHIPQTPSIKKVAQKNPKKLIREVVEGFLDDLEKASIAFNTPTTMGLQETQPVSLLIDPRQMPSELKEELNKSLQGEFGNAAGKQLIIQDNIKISDFVVARLTGSGFKIEAGSLESQVIREDKPTEWTWDVTASEGGHHRLHLTIGTTIKIDGSDDYYEFTSYDKYIDVEVAVTDRLVSFLDKYKEVIGYILGPVSLLGLYQWWQGRKKKAIPAKKKHKTKTDN